MDTKAIANGEVQPCCQDEAKRVLVERRGDLTIEKCAECGRKHYELTVDPLHLNLRTP